MYVLILFLVIVALKFTLNSLRLFGTYFCYGKFKKQSKNLAQLIPFTESLFNSAGTNMFAYQISTKSNTMSFISHFLTDDIQYENLDLAFNRTIGVYKLRILQCINPFYWILLPRYIFEGIRISIPRALMPLIHLLYWIASATAAYFLEMYLDLHWHDFFQQILDKLP